MIITSNCGEIVFDAIDDMQRDKDVLGFDITKNEIFTVSNLKTDNSVNRGLEYDVDEYDPYIVGSTVVFVRSYLKVDVGGFEIASIELYKKTLIDESSLIAVSLDNNLPSFELTYQGKRYILELLSASDNSATLSVTDQDGNKEVKEILEGTAKKVLDIYVFVKNSDETIDQIRANLLIGGDSIMLENAATDGLQTSTDDGCDVAEPSINKIDEHDIVWVGDCPALSKVFRKGVEIIGNDKIEYHSPLINKGDIYSILS